MADDTLPLFPGLDWKKYRIRRGFGPKTKRRPGPLVAVCKACGVAYYPYSKKEYGCSAYCSTVLMFWKDVEKTGTCWIWIGLKTPRGYGYIGTRDHKHILVHRFSYELHTGPIPEDLQIDHLCRNTLCVNPDHLEAVTATENILRSDSISTRNRLRTHCKNGHPFDEANTRWTPNRRERVCRTCQATYARRTYAAKRQKE
jgi:hypothetical protein